MALMEAGHSGPALPAAPPHALVSAKKFAACCAEVMSANWGGGVCWI